MTQIMKADSAHTVLFQDLGEFGAEISRLYQLAKLVDVDIFEIIFAVTIAAQLTISCLLLFYF